MTTNKDWLYGTARSFGDFYVYCSDTNLTSVEAGIDLFSYGLGISFSPRNGYIEIRFLILYMFINWMT